MSKCRIASIKLDDAMILGRVANPDGSNFRKGQVSASPFVKGTVKPDVGTTAAFKSAMLNAASIGYVKQTPTAANMKVIFDKLGIADQVQP